MVLIRDKAVRRQIAYTFKTHLKKLSPDPTENLTLKELDGMSQVLREYRNEANSQATSHFQRELSISYLSIWALAITCLVISDTDDDCSPFSKE